MEILEVKKTHTNIRNKKYTGWDQEPIRQKEKSVNLKIQMISSEEQQQQKHRK